MKISIIPALQLSDDHLRAWSRLQRSDPSLANPFFRPEFTQAVAEERGDVEVAVWEQADEPVGFLPFERSRGRVGRAVGSYMNQFQGAIARADVEWSPREVVRAAGLSGWRFDHLPVSQTAFAPYQYVSVASPYLDVSQGFEHYHKGRGKSAAVCISHILQKDRKAGRELGEVRLESKLADHATLRHLIDWKIDQCRSSGVSCVLGLDWLVRLHERLLDCDTEDFAGTLFTLHMGDRLASALFCLRSHSVLQGSILAYDRELSQFAPGLVLLVRVAQMANSIGIARIDLGSGGQDFKRKLASGCDQVTEGSVHRQDLLAPLYRRWFQTRDRLRSTRLRGPASRVRRWMVSARIKLGYTD